MFRRKSGRGGDDAELVARAASGDRDAYRVLVERYQKRLYSLAFDVLGSREDAEDVVQEAFVKAYVGLRDFRGGSSFYTWVYRIVYNMAVDERRRRGRRGGDPLEYDDARAAHDGRSPVPGPEGELVRKEQLAGISKVLGSVSEDHRRVVMLREIDGLSYDEIAEAVGVSRGTVMSRLHYARKKLQAGLREFAPARRESPVNNDAPASSEPVTGRQARGVAGGHDVSGTRRVV